MNSRYYNPDWGRFLNADSLLGETGDLLSHNMFAYCKNNPVNMADPDGDIAWWIVGGVAGGIAGGIYSYAKTGGVDWRYVAGGALIGAGLGYLAQPTIVYAATNGGVNTVKAGIAQSRINISNSGWKHILGRHFPSKNASQFTISQYKLKSLLQSKDIIKSPIIRTLDSADGIRYVREINLVTATPRVIK